MGKTTHGIKANIAGRECFALEYRLFATFYRTIEKHEQTINEKNFGITLWKIMATKQVNDIIWTQVLMQLETIGTKHILTKRYYLSERIGIVRTTGQD